MSGPHERLRQARRRAGYASAAEAARALSIKAATYTHHENGTRPFTRVAGRYAQFFRVSLDWLLFGRTEARRSGRSIAVMGLVGAGARIELMEDGPGVTPEEVDLPAEGRLRALQVKGDSQWPRFLDGEFILYDAEPVLPETLVGQWAIVQTFDGRRLIKVLRRGHGDNRWRLESHNAPPEDDVQLMGAWRFVGVLPARR